MPDFTFQTIDMDWNCQKLRFRHPDTDKVVEMTTAEIDADATLRSAILTKSITDSPAANVHKDSYNKASDVVQSVEGGAYDGTNTISYDETTIYGGIAKAAVV